MQVQRRQAQKSAPPKLSTERKYNSGNLDNQEVLLKPQPAQQQDHPISDEEKLKLASDSAKRNLLESLNIAAESNSDEQVKVDLDTQADSGEDQTGEALSRVQPDSPGEILEVDELGSSEDSSVGTAGVEVHKMEQAQAPSVDLMERLEAVIESSKESKAKIQHLAEIMNVLEKTAGFEEGNVVVSTPAGEGHLHEPSSTQFGDTVAQAALSSESNSAAVQYQTAQQPSDTSETTLDTIHIVGEIVAAGQLSSSVPIPSGSNSEVNEESVKDTGESEHVTCQNEDSPSVHNQSTTELGIGEEVVEKQPQPADNSVPAKRPKRQLAATFMHNTH